MPDDISGELRQYIGVSLHDAQGNADGFVQIGIRSDRLETLLSSVQIESILDGVKIGQNGFAFAVNANDKTFSYYPDEQLVGSSATAHGMTDKQLQPGYNDFITIDGVSYYASSFESNGNYIYVAQPENELMTERVAYYRYDGALRLESAKSLSSCWWHLSLRVRVWKREYSYGT